MKDRFLLGQYYDADSLIHRLDPRLKMVVTLLYMAALFVTHNWQVYAALAVVFTAAILISRVPLSYFWRGMRLIVIFMIFTLAANIFFTPGEAVFHLGFITVTKEGLIRGGLMGIRLFLLVAFATLLTLTTKPLSLTEGMESLFSPLKILKFPAHEISMVMSIALRFIPTILEELERIMNAQRVRGVDFSSGGLLKRAKSLIPLLVPLFISSFRRADELAQAMEAKCYTGTNHRTHWKPLRWRTVDTLVLLFFIAILTATVTINIIA